jgi:hypothetical protein
MTKPELAQGAFPFPTVSNAARPIRPKNPWSVTTSGENEQGRIGA